MTVDNKHREKKHACSVYFGVFIYIFAIAALKLDGLN